MFFTQIPNFVKSEWGGDLGLGSGDWGVGRWLISQGKFNNLKPSESSMIDFLSHDILGP